MIKKMYNHLFHSISIEFFLQFMQTVIETIYDMLLLKYTTRCKFSIISSTVDKARASDVNLQQRKQYQIGQPSWSRFEVKSTYQTYIWCLYEESQ